MYKGIIFDLDETLIDTTALKQYRDSRDWQTCYSNLHTTTLYEDTKKLINQCSSKDYKIGIVTMSPRPYAERLLSYHGIPYDALIAYRDVINKKPDPEPMIKCAEKLRLQNHELITVGDDIRDIISSKRAGIDAVGVNWGVGNKESLVSVGALQVFDNCKELINFLEIS